MTESPGETLAFDQLLETLSRVGDPPCKGCGFYRYCAEQPAACRDYLEWLETGVVRELERVPTRDLFDFVEEVPPFTFGPNDGHVRNQLLRVLSAEAPHTPRLRATKRISDRTVLKYRNWLRELDIEIGPAALSRLLWRYEPRQRRLDKLTALLRANA